MVKFIKRVSIIFSIVVFCLTTCIALSSCGGVAGITNGDIDKVKTTAYFGEVNTIAKEFNNALAEFQTDVKDKNIESMQNKVKDTQNLIDQFNKIDVPQNCAEVQQTYSDAFLQLQQSLSDYVQIYSDFAGAQFDNFVLNERISNVQKSYNQGIELLKKADKLASEI